MLEVPFEAAMLNKGVGIVGAAPLQADRVFALQSENNGWYRGVLSFNFVLFFRAEFIFLPPNTFNDLEYWRKENERTDRIDRCRRKESGSSSV